MTKTTYYSLRQAAQKLGCSHKTAQRAYQRSGIEGIQQSNVTLITESQLKKLAKYFEKDHPNAKGKKE